MWIIRSINLSLEPRLFQDMHPSSGVDSAYSTLSEKDFTTFVTMPSTETKWSSKPCDLWCIFFIQRRENKGIFQKKIIIIKLMKVVYISIISHLVTFLHRIWKDPKTNCCNCKACLWNAEEGNISTGISITTVNGCENLRYSSSFLTTPNWC